MEKKDQLVDDLYSAVMKAVQESFEEVYHIIDNMRTISDDDITIPEGCVESDMTLDLMEDRIRDAIRESLCDMIKDGEISINED